MIKLVQSTMVLLKFRTKDCAHAAQTFSHLAHGARISWSRVIILVSAGFQPNAPQQDYPLDWAPQHAMKIKRSQRSHSIEMKKENHLFYGIESWDRQLTCSERKLRPQKTKQINASERNSGADQNPNNPLIEGAMLARFLPNNISKFKAFSVKHLKHLNNAKFKLLCLKFLKTSKHI